ncbi:MAG TPA: crosslink repair DNA glycosylase YcaQ family protein, partial [Pilimelia sp.]|nr:crosslink repair DNA glycosylase YcaQ family protein [Pilimelia sp.]
AHAENARWRAFLARVERERPGYVAAVEREVAERGPLAFGELRDPARREKGQTRYAESTLLWYRWSDGKTVLEGLFDAGRLAAADRRGFERRYDLAERVIPPDVLSVPAPAAPDAHRALIRHAAGALGVATVRDFADYFRLPVASTRARLRELVDGGELRPARVQGWADGAYLFPAADSAPVDGRALLSPFDSLLWERDRTERLFGFNHTFELYVKAPNRRYGYYVLPFLLGDMLVGRVDLKADRETRTLHVLGAFAESSAPGAKIAGELAAELRDLADWLGLDTVEVSERGDLARPLRQARPDGAPRFSPSRPRRSSAPG